MKIAIGSDHRGIALKEAIKKFLSSKNHEVMDYGTNIEESCDYPLIAFKVAKAVSDKKQERGILICNTGIGMSIAANKVPNIRAGVVNSVEHARLCREHNDCNVLCLGASFVDPSQINEIIGVFLTTKFLGERHARRIGQISDIEKKEAK